MLVGNYVKTFAEADMGMLEGASLDAPYEFHWLYIKSVGGCHIVCTTRERGGREITLAFRKGRGGDRAWVTVQDPVFGPKRFEVAPFKRSST